MLPPTGPSEDPFRRRSNGESRLGQGGVVSTVGKAAPLAVNVVFRAARSVAEVLQRSGVGSCRLDTVQLRFAQVEFDPGMPCKLRYPYHTYRLLYQPVPYHTIDHQLSESLYNFGCRS